MEFFHRNSDTENSDANDKPEVPAARRESPEAPKPAPAQDFQPVERETAVERDWQMIGLQALAALIIILIVVFGGRWLHHELSHKSNVNPAPANTKQLPAVPNGTTGSKAKSGSNKSSASNSTNSSTNPTPSTNNSNLPNTGPGNDLAIFLVVAFVAASLHYLAGLRARSNTKS